MKAMLLAAGRGERMGPLTADRPKPLLSLGPETLLERHLRRLAEAGVREIVINLSWRGEQIRAAVGDTTRWGQTVRYSEEGEPPLETAGGIRYALPLLGDEPFLVVSADVVTDFDFRRLVARSDVGPLAMRGGSLPGKSAAPEAAPPGRSAMRGASTSGTPAVSGESPSGKPAASEAAPPGRSAMRGASTSGTPVVSGESPSGKSAAPEAAPLGPLAMRGESLPARPAGGERPASSRERVRMRPDPCRGRLVLVPNPPHHPDGDFGVTSRGVLDAVPPRYTYSGIAVLTAALFRGLAPGAAPLRDVLRPAVRGGALRGEVFEGLWRDVGTPARLAEARALLRSRRAAAAGSPAR